MYTHIYTYMYIQALPFALNLARAKRFNCAKLPGKRSLLAGMASQTDHTTLRTSKES